MRDKNASFILGDRRNSKVTAGKSGRIVPPVGDGIWTHWSRYLTARGSQHPLPYLDLLEAFSLIIPN